LIGKILLIRESGILPFYFSQDSIELDSVLLSGFCMANYNVAKELKDSIDVILMKNKYKIIFEDFNNSSNIKFLIACLSDNYHINEGIKKRLKFIFDKFFKEYPFVNDCVVIDDVFVHNQIKDIVNDLLLQNLINENTEAIHTLLDPIIAKSEDGLFAYALTSSTNNILLCNVKDEILKVHPNKSIELIIEEYLNVWNLDKVPQSDIFQGFELLAGLDLNYFCEKNEKIYGLCINTSIHLKNDAQNEILLLFFGTNTLMRQLVMNIEDKLTYALNL
jgi:hypothetical protein